MDPTKVENVLSWLIPKSMKEFRGFLGLSDNCKMFICSYGVLAKPLTELLKKNEWTWNQQVDDSFQVLKVSLSTYLVLSLPDLHLEFCVDIDVSNK